MSNHSLIMFNAAFRAKGVTGAYDNGSGGAIASLKAIPANQMVDHDELGGGHGASTDRKDYIFKVADLVLDGQTDEFFPGSDDTFTVTQHGVTRVWAAVRDTKGGKQIYRYEDHERVLLRVHFRLESEAEAS